MITHKQYPNHHIFETEIGGRTFTVETGKVAELANAEAICRYGDTVVLVTVTASALPKVGIDYFPLKSKSGCTPSAGFPAASTAGRAAPRSAAL